MIQKLIHHLLLPNLILIIKKSLATEIQEKVYFVLKNLLALELNCRICIKKMASVNSLKTKSKLILPLKGESVKEKLI